MKKGAGTLREKKEYQISSPTTLTSNDIDDEQAIIERNLLIQKKVQ
jgi:hypothetical protein